MTTLTDVWDDIGLPKPIEQKCNCTCGCKNSADETAYTCAKYWIALCYDCLYTGTTECVKCDNPDCDNCEPEDRPKCKYQFCRHIQCLEA